MSDYTTAVSDVAEAIRQRYNVRSLDDVPVLAALVKQAQAGNLEPLATALAEREMYRWAEAINDGLARARAAQKPSPASVGMGEETPPSRSATARRGSGRKDT
jgi:hypothetical protein